MIAWELDFDLRPALQAAAAHLPIPASAESLAACLDFIIERLRNVLLEQGRRYDVVDAVLAAQGANPARAARAVSELIRLGRPPRLEHHPAGLRPLRAHHPQPGAGLSRCIRRSSPSPPRSICMAALLAAEAAPRRPGSVDDFLQAFLPMIPAVNRFFDEVLVMAEDDPPAREPPRPAAAHRRPGQRRGRSLPPRRVLTFMRPVRFLKT